MTEKQLERLKNSVLRILVENCRMPICGVTIGCDVCLEPVAQEIINEIKVYVEVRKNV